MSNPLYALLIAYTNDFLEHEDMAAASGGLIFINGIGAIAGPLITGWMMGLVGPEGFLLVCGGSVAWACGLRRFPNDPTRINVRCGRSDAVLAHLGHGQPVAVEVAQEIYIEAELEEAESAATETPAA
jgi:MFS family permease